ncbi:probable envelope ADP,ATP carrier protein, chloroplastic, partial [Tanacetum coccineum]
CHSAVETPDWLSFRWFPKEAAVFGAGCGSLALLPKLFYRAIWIGLRSSSDSRSKGWARKCKEAIGFATGFCISREQKVLKAILRGELLSQSGDQEGLGSFYRGLGPSLIGIAPYVAVNFCVFDLVKKALPEKFRNRPEASILTAFVAASIATLTCYPLDTVRRQMQMRGTPYKTILDAIPAIVARDGVAGLYRGFVPNALKTLPNSSIKLTTFDAMKRLISASEIEFQRILEENRSEQKQGANASAF